MSWLSLLEYPWYNQTLRFALKLPLVLLPSLALFGPEGGGIPSDGRNVGAGVTALFPCSEQCGVSTKLSLSTKPPPGWVPLNLAPYLVHDGPAPDQPGCLCGCGLEAPLAL